MKLFVFVDSFCQKHIRLIKGQSELFFSLCSHTSSPVSIQNQTSLQAKKSFLFFQFSTQQVFKSCWKTQLTNNPLCITSVKLAFIFLAEVPLCTLCKSLLHVNVAGALLDCFVTVGGDWIEQSESELKRAISPWGLSIVWLNGWMA